MIERHAERTGRVPDRSAWTAHVWVGGPPVNRFGFMLKIRPEMADEYQRHHAPVWPEMLDALRRAGWHNYSLFLGPDGTLFGYVETPGSLADAREAMASEPVNERWQSLMARFFDGSGLPPDQMMDELEEVFHLD